MGTGCNLLCTFLFLDCSDGLVARLKEKPSELGALVDTTCDRVVIQIAILAQMGYSIFHGLQLQSMLCACFAATIYMHDVRWLSLALFRSRDSKAETTSRKQTSVRNQTRDKRKKNCFSLVAAAPFLSIAFVEKQLRLTPWVCVALFLCGISILPQFRVPIYLVATVGVYWAILMDFLTNLTRIYFCTMVSFCTHWIILFSRWLTAVDKAVTAWLLVKFPFRHEKGIADQQDNLRLGPGWYPLELWAGEKFRWANNDAQVFLPFSVWGKKKVLKLELEPGPGIGSNQSRALKILDRKGRTVAQGPSIGDRQKVELELPATFKGSLIRIFVDSENRQIDNDPRVLNLRVLKIALHSK